ncbi:preprotein translocase subunit SecE [Amycolatopsis albispora]|uniref:Protein translocase subunit SecE n=1 Tax=Amycolatopsis albispora TaxID=1804986 RepID=A0A344LFD6_9PSEU|nr:preprotein translocase subunit SecE [Amycolatopsis albispora]AXB46760.1 preprotein translocase subunit SecE [Amycolatopsis albispora]
MSEDGEKDQEKGPKRPSRPVTAAARRERRASARPAGKAGAAKSEEDGDKTRPAGKASDAKAKPTPKRDRKEKQASPIKRLVRFIREVWAELRKVIWPTRKQMVTYTAVVLVFLAFMVALVFGLDLVFHEAIGVVFGN